MSEPRSNTRESSRTAAILRLACAVTVFAALCVKIGDKFLTGGLYVEDDAYYYILTAKNIAATGASTFDRQSLTNGYHPLWLCLLVLQNLTVGPSLLATLSLEAALLAGGLFLFLRQIPPGRSATDVAFALCFIVLFGAIGLDGMEVALLIFCVGLFVTALAGAILGRSHAWLWLGLAAAASIGARIDSAFFIVPALILAPVNRRTRLLATAVIAALGAAYAAYNLWMFGALMPISSTIKSLGGLQINHPLLGQLSHPLDPVRHVRGYLITLAALIASPAILMATRRGTLAWSLAAASTAGGLIYLIKLLFLSSWKVWPWYNFAVLFPLLAAFYGLDPLARDALARSGWKGPQWVARWSRPVGALVSVAGLAVLAALAAHLPLKGDNGFATINRMAVARFAGRLNDERLAMGDRAGSFAMAYGGPVVQLEGLVNDKAYFEQIRRSGDIHALLCRRGVKALAAYQQNLGDYREVSIPLLRPDLTQFKGPSLRVRQADEIGHVEDLRIYDSRRDTGAGDNTLYLWRLSCP